MIEIDNIYNMDCLEGMKQIPDGTIDAVICDLPYGVLNKNNPCRLSCFYQELHELNEFIRNYEQREMAVND